MNKAFFFLNFNLLIINKIQFLILIMGYKNVPTIFHINYLDK